MAIDGKREDLIVREKKPFNAEPKPEDLGRALVTPTDTLFVRNHAPVPEIDDEAFRLKIDGLVETPMTLTLSELKGGFPSTTLTAQLQCAGNRRTQLFEIEDVPDEVPWSDQAIGNIVWEGTPLAAVLERTGIDPAARHVAFEGLDRCGKEGETFGYGGSIPLDKARRPEVLLAWGMNGGPLPPVHGRPLRVVVPGWIGARAVKWLGRITLQEEPSDNYFQQRAYRRFGPEARPDTADWDAAPMLGPLPLNSAILTPIDGDTVPAGPVLFRGWATASEGRRIEAVELTEDGGETWIEAELSEDQGPWAWRLWEAVLECPAGRRKVAVRARDDQGETQPADPRPLWNFKGYFNNAWDRVTLTCE